MVGAAGCARCRRLCGWHRARSSGASRRDGRPAEAARRARQSGSRNRARPLPRRSGKRRPGGHEARAHADRARPRAASGGRGIAFHLVDRAAGAAVIRSFLFVPANVPRRVEKGLTLEADAVILDLEDSVAPSDKAPSRDAVVQVLARPWRALVYVRVNAPSTQYCYADLVATVQKGLDGVVVPRID